MLAIFASVWRWRRLVWTLGRRDFQARYAGSALGALWAVLEPAVQFALYLTVFSYFLGMKLEGRPGMGAFGLYLVTGLVPFLAFQEALMRAVGLARSQANLVRHLTTPLEVLAAGAFLAILGRYAIALALVIVTAAGLGSLAWAQLPWLVVGVLLLVVGSWGMTLLLVPGGAFLPDLGQVVGTGTMVLFFLTPVVYPESVVPRTVAPWLALNPLVGVLDTFRAVITGTGPSALRLVGAAAGAGLCLAAGSTVFRRRAWAIRDVV
jgi:lipopolysaccharide transport system permease protein